MKISKLFKLAAAILAATLYLPPLPAAEIGGPAPGFKPSEWLNGKPVTPETERGRGATVLMVWVPAPRSEVALRQFMAAIERCKGKAVRFAVVSCSDRARTEAAVKSAALPCSLALADLAAARAFMRSNDRLPLAVVIGSDGRLLWRGTPGAVGRIAESVADGSYNLDDTIRKEKFSLEFAAALQKSDFKTALKLIDAELGHNSDSAELLSLKAALLVQKLDRPDEALAAVEAGIAANPKNAAIYDLGVKIMHSIGREERLAPLYRRLAAEFPDRPDMLMKFADFEMSRPVEDMRPECIQNLAVAALASPKFADDHEKGMITFGYSRAMYLCGRPDLALTAIKQALPLLKGSKEYESAKKYAAFYNRVAVISSQLK